MEICKNAIPSVDFMQNKKVMKMKRNTLFSKRMKKKRSATNKNRNFELITSLVHNN